MRKIGPKAIAIASLLMALSIAGVIGGFALLGMITPYSISSFAQVSVISLLVASIGFVLLAALFLRGFLRFSPFPIGEIPANSKAEFTYQVYILMYLMIFYPLLLSGLIPLPIKRLLYVLLGARLGDNTYPAGLLHDPHLVRIGKNAIIGNQAQIIPHALEGTRLAHYPIQLGDNVTVGVNSVLFAGVMVGDGAVIAANTVVTKHTVIGPNELWAGVPAVKVKDLKPATIQMAQEIKIAEEELTNKSAWKANKDTSTN